MKFKKRGEEEKQVELYLEESVFKGVILKAREGNTTWGVMLFKDGKFSRCRHINKDSLMDVDSDGSIKEAE